MFTNNEIPKTTLVNYTSHAENDSSGSPSSFSGRSITHHGVNFSYFPKQKELCNVDCLNITQFTDHKAVVTFYFGEKTLGDWLNITESYGPSFIGHHDVHHQPCIHKKESPFDRHSHVLIESDKLESYVQEVSEEIGLSSVDIEQIQHSTRQLCNNPGESSIKFEDGSYAENGGAHYLP